MTSQSDGAVRQNLKVVQNIRRLRHIHVNILLTLQYCGGKIVHIGITLSYINLFSFHFTYLFAFFPLTQPIVTYLPVS
jgi:hypothetical protein